MQLPAACVVAFSGYAGETRATFRQLGSDFAPYVFAAASGDINEMDEISIDVVPRTAMGKKNRALRRAGIVPLHLYGLSSEPLAVQSDIASVRSTITQAGATTPVTVRVKGGEQSVSLIRGVARHPVGGQVLHVDFMRVDVQAEVEAEVPVVLINEADAPGTRGGAGTVTQGSYSVVVSARPFDIPHELQVDCSVLVDLEAMIRAEDLQLPAGVTLVTDGETQIAWIQPPRVAETFETAEEAEGAAAEGEEPEEAGGSEDER